MESWRKGGSRGVLCALAGALACTRAIAAYGQGGQTILLTGFLLLLFGGPLWPQAARRTRVSCMLLAIFWAFWQVAGFSIARSGGLGDALAHPLPACFALAGHAALACSALLLLCRLWQALAQDARSGRVPSGREQKRVMLLCAALLLAGYVPWLILYAPGLNLPDTVDQLLMAFGYPSILGDGSVMTDHHPVLTTWLYAALMRLGMRLGSANLGQLIYSLASLVAVIFAYVYGFGTLFALGLSRPAVLLLCALTALHPLLGSYAINMGKDATAAPFVLLLCALTLRMVHSEGEAIRSRGAGLAWLLALLGLMACRKPSLACILFALPFWLLRWPKGRKRIGVITLAACLLFQGGVSGLLLPALGVVPGETREMLSIPLQQTARWLSLYGEEEMTPREREAVAAVLPLEEAAKAYRPELSDPVKNQMKEQLPSGALSSYGRAWLTMGLRHPTAYVDAWLAMTWGYFNPMADEAVIRLGLSSPDQGALSLSFNARFAEARARLRDFFLFEARNIPGYGIALYTAGVTWAFLALLLLLTVDGGVGRALPWMFFVGTLGICLLSPKNGEIRYILPVLYALPLLMGEALLGSGTKNG